MNTLIVSKLFLITESIKSLLAEIEDVSKRDNILNLREVDNEVISNYDFIFIDTNEYEIDDFRYIESVKKNYSNIKWILIDFSKNEDSMIRALKIKVDAYLTTIHDKEEFLYIFKMVKEGRKFYDGDLIQSIFDRGRNKIELNLTKREKQIMNEVAKGYSNLDISKKYNVTEYTVKKHVSSILTKLHLKNRKQIIIYNKNKDFYKD